MPGPEMTAGIPLALYVHMPWCVAKCPYCDFNSHPVPRAGLPERAYVDALLDDLEYAASEAQDRELVSVFFGGGTPSLFAAASIARVLERAARLVPLAPDIEVTLEANPGTVEHGRFAEYRAAGVNRVSLGAQSFDDVRLAALGRIHRADETRVAIDELRSAGIGNFNLDLMYALPGQSVDAAIADLDSALEFAPAHISHYQLTLEPGTTFHHRPPPLPDEDEAYAMQVACQQRLADAGFVQYEVSAYARAGRRCRHNLVYWEFGDYLGVGAGAHGKLTRPGTREILRSSRVKSPTRYLGALINMDRIEEERVVPVGELPFEYCLNALRLTDGFAWRDYECRTGLARSSLEPSCAAAEAEGLVERVTDPDGWRPTELGRRFLNDLQARFLPTPARHVVGGSSRPT